MPLLLRHGKISQKLTLHQVLLINQNNSGEVELLLHLFNKNLDQFQSMLKTYLRNSLKLASNETVCLNKNAIFSEIHFKNRLI